MKVTDANDRIEEIEELFEQNDADGNGDIDANKDGRINVDEFIAWWLAD